MRKPAAFFALLAATLLLLHAARFAGMPFTPPQVAAVTVFATFIYGTLLFAEFRLAFAFGGIAVLLASGLLTVPQFIESASLDVIVFLIGTFLVIGFLEEDQFFEHVVAGIVTAIGPRPQLLLVTMTALASLASALVGEVTAILFMAGAMLHLTSKYKLRPTPFVILLVFACNVGSAASSVGNPIGVLIALKTGLTFTDFVAHAAPTAVAVDAVTFLICRRWFAADFRAFAAALHADFAAATGAPRARDLAAVGATAATTTAAAATRALYDPEMTPPIENLTPRGSYRLCWAVFATLVLLLATHGLTERLLGLHEGTMMIAASLFCGSVVLLIRRERARDLVERRVDWWTLAFFLMLFASVGTLEHTRVTHVVAAKLTSSVTSPAALVQIVGWATGWLSAFLDNVLAVATFMPVVHDIRAAAAPAPYPSSIYWMMLFGGTFMGNMTVIGSTANIVAVGLLEKRGHGTVGFAYWMKIGFLVSIAGMLTATALLALQTHLFGMKMLEHP